VAFQIKQWLDKFGSGGSFDQPTDTGIHPMTPADAAGMRDLELRLSGYTDAVGETKQPLDSDLTAIAALSTTTFGRALLALTDAAAMRAALGDETVNTVAAAGASQTIPAPTTASLSHLTLTAASCALTFPAAAAGRSFSLVLKQDATGSRAVTWPSIRWAGGDTEPTLTTTAGKEDWFTFACADGSTWVGFVAGQNA
jgi:hypothetical protein